MNAQALVAEFIGTFAFIFAGAGAAALLYVGLLESGEAKLAVVSGEG
ncbi:MAG: hypothetical protein ACE5H9_17160 [Anaerolineae bacterium]